MSESPISSKAKKDIIDNMLSNKPKKKKKALKELKKYGEEIRAEILGQVEEKGMHISTEILQEANVVKYDDKLMPLKKVQNILRNKEAEIEKKQINAVKGVKEHINSMGSNDKTSELETDSDLSSKRIHQNTQDLETATPTKDPSKRETTEQKHTNNTSPLDGQSMTQNEGKSMRERMLERKAAREQKASQNKEKTQGKTTEQKHTNDTSPPNSPNMSRNEGVVTSQGGEKNKKNIGRERGKGLDNYSNQDHASFMKKMRKEIKGEGSILEGHGQPEFKKKIPPAPTPTEPESPSNTKKNSPKTQKSKGTLSP